MALLFMSDFWVGILNLQNAKNYKKKISEELMLVAWQPSRWWDWWVSEDQKKEIVPIFIKELQIIIIGFWQENLFTVFYTDSYY